MAYFWVSQNKTWQHEIPDGFLWAPTHTKNGGPPMHHWLTMTTVQPGDIIFSYVDATIKAIAVVKSPAEISQRPPEFGHTTDTNWAGEVGEWKLSTRFLIPRFH